ncbi:hypothetical protein HPP92_025780 [Vanilla planifolia]|uniref:Uncharacterized protein n=1 Tax=Vanilla planifolia TaxID=51239 RepID=A0A835UBC9_VANPL|nr:hypothetical protein HPP92_025780 [Vanilla planifolia]
MPRRLEIASVVLDEFRQAGDFGRWHEDSTDAIARFSNVFRSVQDDCARLNATVSDENPEVDGGLAMPQEWINPATCP